MNPPPLPGDNPPPLPTAPTPPPVAPPPAPPASPMIAPPAPPATLIITTGNDIIGQEISEYLGIVRGIVVRSTGIARGITGSLRSLGGGNIPEYAAVCEEARQHSYALMIQHAIEMGADAVIAFRYDATEFVQGSTEVLAYGTAVKLKKSSRGKP